MELAGVARALELLGLAGIWEKQKSFGPRVHRDARFRGARSLKIAYFEKGPFPQAFACGLIEAPQDRR